MENSLEIEMYEWSCASCGCIMQMTKEFNSELKSSHRPFYCVNGHANGYTKKTDVEEMECKLMNEYAKNAQLEAEIKKLKEKLINRLLPPK